MSGNDWYSADKNFGYTYMPDLLAASGVPTGDQKDASYSGGKIPPLNTTNWDGKTIDEMVRLLAVQHDGHFSGAALAWGKVVDLLNELKVWLATAGTTLELGWDPARSDAAANFFQHLGASTWSLDDWIIFATQNKQAVDAVATAISTARTKMATIYKNYLSEWNYNINKANYYATPEGMAELSKSAISSAAAGGMPVVSVDDWQAPYVKKAREARQKYTDQAKQVMADLGEAYASNWGALNEGRKFQGPTNAVNPLAALQNKLNQIMSGGPGGAANTDQIKDQLRQQLVAQQQAELQRLAQQRAAQQAAERAARLAAQQAAEQAARQLAMQQAAEQAAQQLAGEQAAANAATRLAAEQAAQQLLAQQMAMRGFGTVASFQVANPGQVGGPGPGMTRAPGVSGTDGRLLGEPSQFDAAGPGRGRGAGAGNPLLGRAGLGPGGEGGMGGAPGRGGPANPGLRGAGGGRLLGRRDAEEQQPRDDEAEQLMRPESEEYLADLPPTPAARLLRGTPRDSGPSSPVGPSLGGRSAAGQPEKGRTSRRRSAQELAGRRRRTRGSGEVEDELMPAQSPARPDLTGRHNLPAVDLDEVAGVVADDSLLGARGQQPAAADPTRQRVGRHGGAVQPAPDGGRIPEAEDAEFWTVQVPERIETPVAQPTEERGRILGSGT